MVGLEKILIPLREEDLSLEKIQEYLPAIMEVFERNANKSKSFYEKYKGQHNILTKQRPFGDVANINNKVVEQHLWAMVNFKCGYLYGNPLQFAKKDTSYSEEMETYNKYITSVNFRGLCDSIAEYVYSTGVGYLFTQPKKSNDLESKAPFEAFSFMGDRASKIYSSYIGEKPLFDLIVTPIRKYVNSNWVDYYILSVYTPNTYYEFEYQYQVSASLKPIKSENRGYTLLPLTEFYAYQSRVGIVESVESLQDALDQIDSDSLDNINETVNQLLILLNAKLGNSPEEKALALRQVRENGIMELFDPSKDIKADVKTLTTQLTHSDVNVFKNQVKADMYATWGVPLAMSGIKSGNVTQGGSEVSNGWEHAYSTGLKESNNMQPCFREWLSKTLWICNNMPDSKVKNLVESDIDIKFNIARSNNMLSKAQSAQYLLELGAPWSYVLDKFEISSDPQTDGKMIEDYIAKNKAEEEAKAERLAQQQNTGINGGDTDDIQRTNTEVVKRQENE